jgi:phosphoribosylformylglycinamidine synthase
VRDSPTIEDDPDFSVEDLREFGSSEFARQSLGSLWGGPPFLRLDQAKNLNSFLAELADKRLISSAQDQSDGRNGNFL